MTRYLLACLLLALCLPAHAFEPIGAFRLPPSVAGSSTAYAAGTLALRTVNGQVRLFSDAGGQVYEAAVPSLRTKPPYNTAKVLRTWGVAYRGVGVCTNLRWDGSLWSTGGPLYDTDGVNDLCSGCLDLKTGRFTDHTLSGVPQLWQRGGTLECPPWWERLTGEKVLYGFGGYYSIFSGGSCGPCLCGSRCLLGFPEPHRCPRPPSYYTDTPDWYAHNDSTWTAADECGGENCAASAIWLNTPERSTVGFFVSLGTGRVWYGNDGFMSGVHCEARENWIAWFDAVDLLLVRAGVLAPWEPVPTWVRFPGPGRVCGAVEFNGLLWVVHQGAIKGEFEDYPLVVVYKD